MPKYLYFLKMYPQIYDIIKDNYPTGKEVCTVIRLLKPQHRSLINK